MKNCKAFAILMAGTLFTGCWPSQAMASVTNPEIILETIADTSATDGLIVVENDGEAAETANTPLQEMPDQETEGAKKVAEEDRVTVEGEPSKVEEVDINTEDVEAGAESFSKKITYRTYNQDADPKDYIPESLVVNGEKYVLQSADSPDFVRKENVEIKKLSFEGETFTGDPAMNEPDETITGENGRSYRLVSKTLNQQNAEERKEYREVAVTFEGVESGIGVPGQRECQIEDTLTGQSVTALLDIVKSETVSEEWTNDFVFPVTVTGYDADVFMLGSVEVPKDADLTDYADEFLSYLGLSKDDYRVARIDWDGEAFEQNGAMVRKAIATGSKKMRDMIVTYGGEVTLPAVVGNSWTCEYEEDVPDDERIIYTMATNVEYSLVTAAAETEKGFFGKVLDKVIGVITAAYEAVAASFKEHPVVSSIPLVCVAAFLAFFISKKRKNLCVYNNKIKCPHKKHNKETCASCVNYRNRQKV